MNKFTIKYLTAAVILTITAAFCGCADAKDDIIALDEVSLDEDGLLVKSLDEGGQLSGEAVSSALISGSDTDSAKSADGAAGEGALSLDLADDATIAALCVYVCGAVENPGVYKLSGDIRLIDAITAAGGMKDDAGAEYLNLASRVADGQKIYVPTTVEVEEAFAAGDDTTYSVVTLSPDGIDGEADGGTSYSYGEQSLSEDTKGLININSAGKEELMTLPGIGEQKALKIIEYREENGGFSSPEDLMNISGIKEGLYSKVKDKICVK